MRSMPTRADLFRNLREPERDRYVSDSEFIAVYRLAERQKELGPQLRPTLLCNLQASLSRQTTSAPTDIG
jgi:hypothetical protein